MISRRKAGQKLGAGRVNTLKVGVFLGLTFGISWSTAILLSLLGIEYGGLTSLVLVAVFFMWAPAIAAIAVQTLYAEPIRRGTGLVRGNLRWAVVAWLAPVGLLGISLAIGVALPGISLTTDLGAFLADMGLSQGEIDEALAVLEGIPVPPIVLFVGQGLTAGLTINAIAALGEELGWRGLLLSELAPLGFWRVSAITGLIWGVWHAPIVLQGHNFPESPLVGVAVMTVWTVVISPVFTYLTVRAQSIIAPTLFHGSFNAVASFSLVYLTGAGNLLLAPVGVVGIVGAALATGVCVAHDRVFADESVTTGEPLHVWVR